MASKRHLRRKVCERKHKYATEEQARFQADRISREQGLPMNYYKCQWGNHWHIGHAPFRLRAANETPTSKYDMRPNGN